MNAANTVQPQATLFRPALGDDFSHLVNIMASRLAAANSLKEELLSTAEDMGRLLSIAANNQINLSTKAIEATRDNLAWMESYLDGESDSIALASLQYARLRKAYQEISQALCVILIQSALPD